MLRAPCPLGPPHGRLLLPDAAAAALRLLPPLPGMEPVPKAVLGAALTKPRRPVIACSICQIRFNSEESSPQRPQLPAPPGPPPPLIPRLWPQRHQGERGGGPGGAAEGEEEEEKAKAKRLLYCALCKVAVNSLSQLEAHNKGTKHKTLVEARSGLGPIRAFPRLGGGTGTPPDEAPERSFHCQICNVHLNSELQLKQHISSRRHRDGVAGKPNPLLSRHKKPRSPRSW
uniref:Zinc finger protein 385A n=1 Tax=Gallus gallus TaxID=9031 RepID=A0A8V0ZI70_CHICK